jgi:hypothetical protein
MKREELGKSPTVVGVQRLCAEVRLMHSRERRRNGRLTPLATFFCLRDLPISIVSYSFLQHLERQTKCQASGSSWRWSSSPVPKRSRGHTGCSAHECFAIRELSLKLLARNVCLLNIISIDYNISLKSLHPSEKNLIQGNCFDTPQNVLECTKKRTAIREFVSCSELLDVAEEIEISRCQIR